VPVLTVIVDVPPASAMGVSTETVGTGAASSSVMVPVALPSSILTFPLAALRVTVNVSWSVSSMLSPSTVTAKLAVVTFAANVTVPVAAV